MAKLYLALGSNQGDRKALLDAARAACDASLGRVTGCSDYIETAPWGFSSPHPFLNAVLELETELSPIDIQLAPTLRHPVLGLSIAELDSRLQR